MTRYLIVALTIVLIIPAAQSYAGEPCPAGKSPGAATPLPNPDNPEEQVVGFTPNPAGPQCCDLTTALDYPRVGMKYFDTTDVDSICTEISTGRGGRGTCNSNVGEFCCSTPEGETCGYGLYCNNCNAKICVSESGPPLRCNDSAPSDPTCPGGEIGQFCETNENGSTCCRHGYPQRGNPIGRGDCVCGSKPGT